MTPSDLNKLVDVIADALESQFELVTVMTVADADGTKPELYVTVNETVLSVIVSPI